MTIDDQAARTAEEEDVFDQLEKIVGSIHPTHHASVRRAIHETPLGVLRLARKIAENPRVRQPAGVLIASVKKGDHLPRIDPKASSERLPMLETALRLFAAKLVDLERHTSTDPDWTQRRRVEFAIDYAIGEAPRLSLALPAGQTVIDVELELRRRVGAAGRVTRVETPEQAFERRRQLGREWQRIQACMHDPQIAAMFRALREQCADPENPTDDEGESTRLALIAEIDHLGVTPRGAHAGPLTPADLARIDADQIELAW